MLLRYFWYLLWIICPLATIGAQAQVTILADSTTMLIGDPLGIRIVVNVPSGAQVVFPIISDALVEEEVVEVLEQGERQFTQGKVNDTYEQPLVLTAWEPGQQQVPELVFSYKYKNEVLELRSLPFVFTAAAPKVTGDSTYVADIKTILAEEPNFWDYLTQIVSHPIVLVLLFLLLGFGAFYAFVSYKKNLKERLERQTPEQWTLEQLELLEAQNYLTQNKFIAYHTAISLILRTYFHKRFKIEALEQPNSYFLPKLEQHPFLQGSNLQEELSTVLKQADLIKYAKASPLPIANEKAAKVIRDVVAVVRAYLVEAAAREKSAARSSKSV
ncbi:MAG: hypothetical protein ACRBFS_05910 [Aureispira sp.]